ncbi:hypothetical protein B0T24DRAFT_605829 [Lasiosphaeria ovina]|uniref:RRM domain-containing protein n=1 Tax=Lasiosphaeria ovina TaxID=92902 RepID=A0AAE0NLI9_9PEZI|nr:hypothetical protein B0T24DRAFT_605829 [Lasiosphaeria ovina]
MNSLRQVALRSAIAASRAVAFKTPTTSFAVQFARQANVTRSAFAIPAVRAFSQTVRVQEYERNYAEEAAAEEAWATEKQSPEFAARRAEQLKQQLPIREAGVEEVYDNSIFIRNLSFSVTEHDILDVCQKFGKVVNVRLATDRDGNSKGFGFVEFETQEQAHASLRELDQSFFQGRRIGVLPRAKERAARPPRGASSPSTSLYVGNIPYETSDEDLNRMFRGLENVKDVRIAVDRTTGYPRGFAHCDFATIEDADKAKAILGTTMMGNRQLVVDYAESHRVINRPRDNY